MKALLSLIISGALVVSGYSQTRNVLVGTNNAVVQPTNFWSADSSNARSGLGLGSAATNPSSAFQPASSSLTNLASGNGEALTNLRATNIVGLIPSSNIPSVSLTNIGGTLSISSGGTGATNAPNARINLGATTIGDALFVSTNAESARLIIGAIASNGDAINLTNFPSSLLRTNGNASGLTNFPSEVFALSNSTGVLSLSQGGTGATNAAGTRTNLGLGSAATNPSSAFQSSSTVLSNLASSNGAALTNLQSTSITGTIAISSGGTGATNVAGARTNLGIGQTQSVTFGALNIGLQGSRIDATNLSFIFQHTGNPRFEIGESNIVLLSPSGALSFGTNNTTGANITRNNLGVGTNQIPTFSNVIISSFSGATGLLSSGVGKIPILVATNVFTANAAFYGWDGFQITAFSAAQARTNLGLDWSALTNTNAGTSLVSVNTNGEVVSPTNFWQLAPIQTLVQDFTLIGGTQTNNATNARNVYVYSLNTNLSGVSNTIILPTNTSTFNGDEVCVIHKGTTNTTTVVRQAGSTNNFITLNKFDESVKFIRELGQWDFYHNISFVESIQFSGTNAAANVAASRTNLGLGTTNTVNFARLELTDTTTNANLWIADQGEIEGDGDLFISAGAVIFKSPIEFSNITNAATTRTNLGLGATWLTNTNVTNFRTAIGLGATNNVIFNQIEIGDTIVDNTGIKWGGSYKIELEQEQLIGNWTVFGAISFNATTNADTTRTNLGLPLAALTNTSVTNFQKAIFHTNTAPSNIGGNLGTIAAWIEIVASNGVTYKIPAYTNIP